MSTSCNMILSGFWHFRRIICFLVGDDDQSIYRFRGARPEIMLQIPKDFPQLKQVILKQNYRCTGEIVEKSQNVIRWNDARYEKQLFTENDKGKPLEIRTFENESEETTWLLKQIQKDLAEGCPHKEIAILFRTNHNCRMTVERLMEYNIPFTMRDVLPNLYEHWLAKNGCLYASGNGRSGEKGFSCRHEPSEPISVQGSIL